MESDIEIKQNFLRTEIMDQGFNPDEFLEFLIVKKGENAADLELWSIDELSEIVKEFKNVFQNANEPTPSDSGLQRLDNFPVIKTTPEHHEDLRNSNLLSTSHETDLKKGDSSILSPDTSFSSPNKARTLNKLELYLI
jgi:hypothetical protein